MNFVLSITHKDHYGGYTPQDAMITLAGYQAETHKVITPDGYILTLYRLVGN